MYGKAMKGLFKKINGCRSLDRINTNDNTPAVLHTEIVEGDRVTITVMPKGGGSENMGTFKHYCLEMILKA